jgi:hypothetical protein
MYGWYNMRFVIGDPGDLPTNFRPRNAPRFADPAASFVFLHGYNVNEMQSRDWSIEMFKRMWWSGSSRKYYAVSWAGDTTQIGALTINYHLNIQQAIATAPYFARFVNSPMLGGDVTVAAHSLANMVVSPAIQDHGARPTRYLMVDCAVAMEAYDADLPKEPAMIHPDWRSYTNRLYASEWHTLFPDSDGRNGLTWRGRFKDVPKFTRVYNFYSSGEEVLENNTMDNVPMITDVLGWQGGFSILPGTLPWALQELLKGRVTTSDFYALYGGLALVPAVGSTLDGFLLYAGVRGGNVVGSKYGGWGFNPYWDLAGTTTTINVNGTSWQIYQTKERRSPEAAVLITPEVLQTNSFFLPFLDEDMYQPLGNWLASDPDTRTRLLAEAIPALTFATGANGFPNRRPLPLDDQFDMNSAFQKRGWPAERTQNSRKHKRWFHSDVRDIPHLYNGDVFKKWVELGGGR